MTGGVVKQQMPVDSATVFALLHNYERRLEWDTLLKKAFLTQGHTHAAKDATSCCVGKPLFGLIAMHTKYIAFDEPRMAAVVLIKRPPLFESFGASIKHTDNEQGSVAEYTFHFRARPRVLRRWIEPVMMRMLKRETQTRLAALAHFMTTQLDVPPHVRQALAPGGEARP